jgi:hypothetical protein
VGGYDISRWPLRVPRAEGESLESWLQRLAHRYGMHPRGILTDLGLQARPQRHLDLYRLFATPEGAGAAGRVGLQPEDLTTRPALAGALYGTRDRHRREFRGMRRPPTMRESRWCAQCLKETGVWQDSWRDPLHLYCQDHGLVLIARCPNCFAVPFASTAWTTSLLGPTRCPDFVESSWDDRYRQRCGASFLHTDQQPADSSDLEDQELLLGHALIAHQEPATLMRACGITGRALTVYEAALEIITNLCGHLDLRIDPECEEQLFYACRVAAQFVNAPDPRTAVRYAARHSAFGADFIPFGPRAKVHAERRNPLLMAVFLADQHERVPLDLELRFRLGSVRPRYPDGWQAHDRILHPADAQPGLPLTSIPQAIWPGALDLPDADGLGMETPVGRTFTSMCLAGYGTDRPVRALATALGLPGWVAPSYRQHWQAIHDAGRWRDYLRALQCLFDRLHEHPPPIDYMQRRLHAQDPRHLKDVTDHILAELNRSGRSGRRAVARSTVARTVWAQYTNGDPGYAPTGYGIRRRRQPVNILRPADIADLWPSNGGPLDDPPVAWAPT